MRTILVIEFVDYVCTKLSADKAWRCLNNVASLFPDSDVAMPAIEIDEHMLQTIEEKAWQMQKEPGMNEYIVDDVKILHSFCAKNGVCSTEAVGKSGNKSAIRKTA